VICEWKLSEENPPQRHKDTEKIEMKKEQTGRPLQWLTQPSGFLCAFVAGCAK
jgi:hypothetical protein